MFAVPAAAQTARPPGPYVVDVRGSVSAIPSHAAFYPPVPTGTIVPSRGFGIDIGGHVYLLRLGPSRLGIGASLLRARGTSSPDPPAMSGSSASTVPAGPDVVAMVTTVAPQVSLNFGSSQGWSYVSAGIGQARVSSSISEFGAPRSVASATPVLAFDGRSVRSINFGFGARWFTAPHVAFSFDVRFHMVSASQAAGHAAATPGTTLTVGSVGISLK